MVPMALAALGAGAGVWMTPVLAQSPPPGHASGPEGWRAGQPLRWISANVEPLFEPRSGSLAGAVVSFTDVTELRQQALQLKLHQTHLEDLVTQRTQELSAALQAKLALESFAQLMSDHQPTLLAYWTRDLRLAFGPQMQRLSLPQLGDNHPLLAALNTLKDVLAEVRDLLDSQAERSPDLAHLHRRAHDLLQRLIAWGAPDRTSEPELCWIDVGTHGLQLHRTPISVADVFKRQRLGDDETGFDDEEAKEEPDAQPSVSAEEDDKPPPPPKRAWVFTSATLAVKNDFTHFTQALGLEDAHCQAWSSPYNYPEQAMLYVPQGLPQPSDARHTEAVVDAALPLIRANRGRAFVLCTSHRAVQKAADHLKQCFEAAGDPYPVLRQGDAPRPTLLDDFRRAGNAVLVGSHSFWEGIDVKGDALTLVVIDKLPFAPPDDPVLAKRLELLEKDGGNPFMEHQVPQAIIALKQGAGRLIRSEHDRGVLMIGDVRLIDRPYGRRIWQSLPPMRRSRVQEDAVAFLASL